MNEDFRNDMNMGVRRALSIIIPALIACLILSFFSSCRSQFVDISDDMFIHDTTYISRVSIDTVIKHDSIWHYECLKGDSVIVKDYVFKYIYKPKIEYRDSIVYRDREQVFTVTKEVEKQLTQWQKIQIWLGKILLIAIGLILGYFAFKLYRKLRA